MTAAPQMNGRTPEPSSEWLAHVDGRGSRPSVVFLPYDEIFAPEPEARVVVPGLGLAAGPVSALFAAGFVGKTLIALAAGLAISSGRPLWGVFRVERGRWLHLDYEQGRRHTKRRVVRLMAGMKLDREEMRGRFELAIYPRLNLTTTNAEEHFAKLFEGFSFVTIDALRGIIPGVDENAAEVRDYIDALSRAAERAQATVLVLHHAGKAPINGGKARREMGRGSSAIFDACSSVFVATAEKGEPITMSHEKDRERGATLDDFGLRIVDVEVDGDPKGGLRVEHLEREQMSRKRDIDTIGILVARVVEAVKANPGASTRVIRVHCKGARATEVDAALEEAERRKLVTNLGTEKRSEWRATGGAA